MLWAALIIGFVGGLYVGDHWREWLGEGWDWLVSLLAAIGLVAVVVIAVAAGTGWRP